MDLQNLDDFWFHSHNFLTALKLYSFTFIKQELLRHVYEERHKNGEELFFMVFVIKI